LPLHIQWNPVFDTIEIPQSLTSAHHIKLTLREGEKNISDNFYWRGLEDGNYQALNQLPKAEMDKNTKVTRSGGTWVLTTVLKNTSSQPDLMVRLKVVGETNGERMLPAFFSDNFVSLMPGEEKVITMKLENADTRGEKPKVEISGFNL
jgi:hypothetical protein